MEHFLYHRVTEDMHGSILYPLNQLKGIYPDAYAEHVKKYVGRESLLKTQLPMVDCLWNDVIHFTAVPPKELLKNMLEAGMPSRDIVWKHWFKVPASLLTKENTVVCLYRRDISIIPDARDFSTFNPEKIPEYSKVPPETIEYYKEQFKLGSRPFFFHRVPHILYKGTIDTTGLEIVEI